jgi:sulfate/thiosulfate-binding protein
MSGIAVKTSFSNWTWVTLFIIGCGPAPATPMRPVDKSTAPQGITLLNVANDPTRELWKDLNTAFARSYLVETGTTVEIKQSHASSASQARAVIDGLEADVVSLAVWPDTDQLQKKGLIHEGWEDRLPNRSLPYTTPIVFVVRKGNPKQIKDWPDLTRGDIEIITPNPKTSGNGKLSFLAAWGSVIKNGGTEEQARDFVTKLYQRVSILDTGSRGSTTTFAQKGQGDVHLAFESEAHLEVLEAKGDLEIVLPSLSMLAEPHVAVVDANVDKKKTRKAAEAYLRFLYTDEGQELIAKHHYRPTNAGQTEKHSNKFPALKLFSITEIASGWPDAQERFFAEGALFDTIYKSK